MESTSHPPQSRAASSTTTQPTPTPSRPPLGPRLLSQDRRPSAFSGAAATAGEAPAAEDVPAPRTPVRKDSLRGGNGSGRGVKGGNRPQLEADFTTTFPQQPSISSTINERTHVTPAERTLSSQASFVNPPRAEGDPSLALARSGFTTSSTPSQAPPTNTPTPTAPLPPPSAPRSRQPSTTARPPPSSSTPRRQDPLLPSANVTPAPPTGMYWSRTPVAGRVPRGMRAHSASVVGGNEVWCFGGCDIRGGCFKDVWKLDCDTFTWSKPKVMGDIPPVTRAHTATVVDRRLFIFGGGDGPHYYNDTYVFDTVCHTWSKPTIRGTPPSRRRAHTAVLYDSRIIIFGGGNGANALNDVHALDVSDLGRLEWKEVETRGRRPIARGYHSMNLVGGKCVVFGGSDGTECFSDVFVLDLETLTWTEIKPSDLAPLPSPPLSDPTATPPATALESFPRLSHTSTTVGSYLFIVGGHDGVAFSSDVLLFNLVTLTFEPRPLYGLPPSPRGYHTTVLVDSRILVLGGFNGSSVFDEVWTLDLGGSAFLPQITNFGIVVDGEGWEE